MPTDVKVFYHSHGPEPTYAMLRESVPPGFELVTLERDDDAERRDKVRDCEVVIVAAHPLRRPIIDAAPRLALVHHQGVGYHDTVEVDALKERSIRLALTPAGTTTGVAEHTVLLILAACKRLPYADAELRRGHWHVNTLRPISRELAGSTVGLVGLGRIGRAVAERLRPFQVRVLYTDPAVALSPADAKALGAERVPLARLLAESDIVSLHTPLTSETRHLIDARTISQMKEGAYLINTARGPIVEQTALVEALRSGRLAAAALDVFEAEPLLAGNPLAELPNVVLTPHVAAGTRQAMAEKMRTLFANVERFYRGEPMENEVVL